MKIRSAFVRQMARKVLRECEIQSPPVDLRKVLSAYGMQYEEVDDFPDSVDALIIEDGSRVYAAVNARQHPHRQRFSIAHELGHYLLHREYDGADAISIDNPPSEDPEIGSKSPIEAEADLFAGELLVPVEMLKPYAREPLSAIGKVFAVSEQVVSIALVRHMKTLFK